MDRFYVNPVPPSGSERRIPSEQPTAGRRSPPRLRHFRFLFLAGSRRRTRRPSTQRVGERRAPRSAALAARLTPPSSHREPRSARRPTAHSPRHTTQRAAERSRLGGCRRPGSCRLPAAGRGRPRLASLGRRRRPGTGPARRDGRAPPRSPGPSPALPPVSPRCPCKILLVRNSDGKRGRAAPSLPVPSPSVHGVKNMRALT